jgi:hypothetical protein
MKAEETSMQGARPTVPQLALAWQQSVAAVFGETRKRPLSGKEIGQLKRLRNLLGEESGNVVSWAVENWVTFAALAEMQAGLSGSPAHPHLGFLVAHGATAVNLMAKKVPEQVAKIMAQAAREREEAIRRIEEENRDTTASDFGN